ncbi:hypothetical protein SLE2022_268940 [Rubroshorea leprosula]|uniref:Epidermal patterning factor-like protein n=1 Tax=Rubroshorea leprosula TaxID=152421 RepID=A0AAV5JNF1_9ROSI|nr:hypothetical protein SLEP1_g24926 [Rubroshorea leprosula]
MEKGRMLCCFLLTTLQIINWVSPHQQEQIPQVVLNQEQGLAKSNEGKFRLLARLGSRPPNCERKCRDCTPCVATQIPATSDRLGPEFTNYEPEGWKCKCGSSFFSP